jgi:hypothetical protein
MMLEPNSHGSGGRQDVVVGRYVYVHLKPLKLNPDRASII